jgi:hypothetical protein
MTVKLSPPTRVVALVGLAAIVALAAMMLLRTDLIGSSSTSSSAVTTPPKTATSTPQPRPAPASPAKPTVVLLPDLPAQLASKLRQSKVVVVSLYTGTAALDRRAVGEARNGAKEAGSGFVAINVLDEKKAREMQGFVGAISTPTVLVVKRPGKIVTQIEAVTDSAIVAQAARNAGAGRAAK